MAQTYTHSANVLSKVQLGSTTYWLKDADVRAILDTFGSIVTYDKANSITDGGTGIPDADQVYDFVISQIAAVGKALNLISATDHTAVTTPAIGDFVVESDGSEWLYDGHEWREVGSENAYVLKTTEVAGIALSNDITVAQLQEALELGALAYKDSGSVSIVTPDSVNSFTTGKAGTYTISGTAVSVPLTYDALNVTPSGSVTITPGTAAAVSYDKTTSVAISAAAPVEGTSVANYTPSGSVTVTNVSITPASATVATLESAGTAYQLTAGSISQAADTTSAFATEGITATVGTDHTASGGSDESETLIIGTASTSNAVTASGTVTYTDPTLSGALPTFGSESVITGITSASATASFSGDGTVLSAQPSVTSTAATVTQPTYTASFSGTAASVTPTVATSVNAAPSDATVTVDSETITPTLTTSTKTENVTFS